MYGQQKTPEQQRQLYASFYYDAASVNMDTVPGLTHSVDTDDMGMNSKPPEDHVGNIQAYGRILKRDGYLRQQQQDHRMAEQQQQLEYNQKNLNQPQSHQPSSSFYHQQQLYQQQQQQQQQQQFYYQQQQVQQPQSRQQRPRQPQPEQQRQQGQQQRQRQQQQQYHPGQTPSAYSYSSPTEDSSAMPGLTFSEDHSSSSSMPSASGPGAIPGNLALPPQNQAERGVDDHEFFLTSILDMINNTPPATGPGSMSMIPHFDYPSFTERQMIAKGGNGEVRRAFWPTRHCYVVLKSLIDIKHSAAKLAVLFDKEVEVMNRCGSHDNLAQFYGIATRPTDPGSPASSLEPDRFMVMQYYEHGDLVRLLSKPDLLAEAPTLTDKLYLAMDIAVGLDHLYKCGFHHGDLHPKNILIDSRHNAMYSSASSVGTSRGGRYLARLTDFGLRRIRDNTYDFSSQPFGGVWQFMAPERMVRNRPRYNVRCDIFALGVIYWQIMSGRYPFKDPSTYSPGAREPRPEGVPDWYYAVYTRAWSENPLERQQDLEEIVAVFRHHLGIASMSPTGQGSWGVRTATAYPTANYGVDSTQQYGASQQYGEGGGSRVTTAVPSLTSGSKSANLSHPRYKKSYVPNGMPGRAW
ncbi:hypothetical protein BG005_008981 [Podila minutissima]|nr:hypothetical protein BG005_008981 [Podila minutissima]